MINRLSAPMGPPRSHVDGAGAEWAAIQQRFYPYDYHGGYVPRSQPRAWRLTRPPLQSAYPWLLAAAPSWRSLGLITS